MSDRHLVLQERLRGGQAWSRRLGRDQVLRVVDVEGRACVSTLLFNARDPLERYNMPDTLKAQFTSFLTVGRALYSDMGRVLCSVVAAEGCGWHDTISGVGGAAAARARFTPPEAGPAGAGSYQALRNDFHRNARDNFLVELGKHGLGKRDIVANVNLFVRVGVSDGGGLAWVAGNSRPGAWVDLRFEMETLVVLSNTPHPLDPEVAYRPPPVDLSIRRGPPAPADDPCRVSRPENGRGFALTAAYNDEVAGDVAGAGAGARR